ncbi:upstream-binding factor 1-like protein 1 [Syngnathoides biaculeatus]|uniref:upstream-binding factor 1-like protein 1 n=1 Tax=Syngnathoides biaculeatus TaxID=300417 RepID=UPI002ADE2F28|nr:upstream-binding factor 1-like protein 1 [Syngnathoides biaculeatus]
MDTEWTKENISKLLNAMKANISERDRWRIFSYGLKTLDWKEVAFPPFSPKDCQERWNILSQKIRKIRTLTELVDEAADEFSHSPKKHLYGMKNRFARVKRKRRLRDASKNTAGDEQGAQKKRKCCSKETHQDHYESSSDESTGEPRPSQPPLSGYLLYCKEQLARSKGVPKGDNFRACARRWRELNADEKESYTERCMKMKRHYAKAMKDYLSKTRYHLNDTNKDTRPSDSEDEDFEVSSGGGEEVEEQVLDSSEGGDDDGAGDVFDMF